MAVEILLPKLGLTMQEGTIEEWVAEPGTPVRAGDVLLRLATDKVDVDVEAEGEGLLHIGVPAGTTLEPGAVIGWLLADGEQAPPASGAVEPSHAPPHGGSDAAAPAPPSPRPGPAGRPLSSPNARRIAQLHGVDLSAVRGTGPDGRIVSEDVEEHVAARAAAASAPAPAPALPPAGPLVRRRAAQLGVELDTVHGTGPGGKIRREDVERAVPSAPVPAARDSVRPLTGMRGTIAARMHASLQEMAQFTVGREVPVDGVVALREQLRAEWGSRDEPPPVPTITDFVLAAAARALRAHPLLNATIRDGAVHLLPQIDVGLAVAVPDGLLLPVVRGAADRSLVELATATRRLAASARDGRLGLAELEGATFAVSSLGGLGVDFFTPIVTPGTVGILGVGRVRDGVAWDGETPRRTRVLTLSLTVDHRAVDGAPAAAYLGTVSDLLAAPLRLLAG